MALQDYIKTQWSNGTAPAINSVNLLNIEDGIERVTEAVQVLEQAPYDLPPADEVNLGGVKIKLINNGDGTYSGEIWV